MAHTTLAGQVLPSLTLAVQRIDDEKLLAGLERRIGHKHTEQLAVALKAFQRPLGVVIGKLHSIVNLGRQHQFAIARADIVANVHGGGFSAPGQLVIPHGLITILGDWEGNTTVGICDPRSAFIGVGTSRVSQGIVIYPLRRRRRAMCGVHV
ncbi:hypothetical protein D3C71_1325780 [compost metagenome]